MKTPRCIGLVAAAAVLFSGLAGADCVVGKGFEGLNTAVKGYPVPRAQPVQGVEYVNVNQMAGLLKDPNHVFIDVRPAAFFKACKLNGSINLEYTFAGSGGEAMYKQGPRLTKEAMQAHLKEGKNMVLFCNNAFNKTGCHRAANAAITAVCTWGLPAERIKWFGAGVPGTVMEQPQLTSGTICHKPWH